MSDIGTEIKNDLAAAKAFIQREETVLEQDILDAYGWLKKELEALAPTVVADLKAAAAAAVTEALSGASTGSVVADALTILARDGQAILAQVKGDVVTAVVGLTGAKAS